MPYNNAAIPPPREITGQASLPLARVKRIIHLDEDIGNCSNNAAFVITVATEMFIRYLAEQGQNVVRSERKPRRNIQYRDLANAVARIDNLEFLADVVPRTVPYKQYREKKSREAADEEPVEQGQTTLDGRRKAEYAANGDDESDDESAHAAEQPETTSVQRRVARLDMEIRGGPSNGVAKGREGPADRPDADMDDSPT
ncbi:MAG: hypothetical protein M1832_003587 [Thelocarpon impressellum]|nr:MAG: hypothetical protein M1832_003587 [Thelocarpon impressellum]